MAQTSTHGLVSCRAPARVQVFFGFAVSALYSDASDSLLTSSSTHAFVWLVRDAVRNPADGYKSSQNGLETTAHGIVVHCDYLIVGGSSRVDCPDVANDHYISRFLTGPWEVGQRRLHYYDFASGRFGEASSESMFADEGIQTEATGKLLDRLVESPVSDYRARVLRSSAGSALVDTGDDYAWFVWHRTRTSPPTIEVLGVTPRAVRRAKRRTG